MGNRTKRALELQTIVQRRLEDEAAAGEARSAGRVVWVWNAKRAGDRALWFYPTIGAAIAAKRPWLAYECPSCRTVGMQNLRALDGRYHPNASISSLIPALVCLRCGRDAPHARLIQLTASSQARLPGRLALKSIGREEYAVRFQGRAIGLIVLHVADTDARGPWYWKIHEGLRPPDLVAAQCEGYRRTRQAAQRAFREAWEKIVAMTAKEAKHSAGARG
jgi:hypothetical protein